MSTDPRDQSAAIHPSSPLAHHLHLTLTDLDTLLRTPRHVANAAPSEQRAGAPPSGPVPVVTPYSGAAETPRPRHPVTPDAGGYATTSATRSLGAAPTVASSPNLAQRPV